MIVLGGLGFIVLMELSQLARRRRRLMSLHTRVVCWTTGVLIVVGTLLFLLLEWATPWRTILARQAHHGPVPGRHPPDPPASTPWIISTSPTSPC
jgi:Trk-type K+ transport system membrane component